MLNIFGPVVQIAFVVKNLDAALEKYSESLGVSDWELFTLKSPDLRDQKYRGLGADFSMRVAIASVPNGPDYEIIEPVAGPNIYADFLAERGEGLHHLAFERKLPFAQSLEKLAAKDIFPVMEGRWGEIRFAYFDTREQIGVYSEIWEMPDGYILLAGEKLRFDGLTTIV